MYGIVANVKSDSSLRTGAKVRLHYPESIASRVKVSGVNKSGRRIEKFVPFKRLRNFRASWVPEQLYREIDWRWEDKAVAEEKAEYLNKTWGDVRYFNRDGTKIVEDGISEGEAFRRNNRDCFDPALPETNETKETK